MSVTPQRSMKSGECYTPRRPDLVGLRQQHRDAGERDLQFLKRLAAIERQLRGGDLHGRRSPGLGDPPDAFVTI
jgi:hypothetical protein